MTDARRPSARLRERTPEQEARHYRKYLAELIDEVSCVIVSIDRTMKGPSTPERGKRLAAATSALAWARDAAAHFGLRQEFPVIKRNVAKTVKQRGGGAVEREVRLIELVEELQKRHEAWLGSPKSKEAECAYNEAESMLLAFDLGEVESNNDDGADRLREDPDVGVGT